MSKKKQDIVYIKKDLHEHILDKYTCDNYIGSIVSNNIPMFIYDFENNKIIEKNINYIGGFFKIFDEILVNSRDHSIRDETCRKIKINFDKNKKYISIYNDGGGIPIIIHKEYDIYIPELIFGNLLTSSNFNEKGKITGGKNGLGAKLTNIFSTKFKLIIIGIDDIQETKKSKKKNMYKFLKIICILKINQKLLMLIKIQKHLLK